MVDRRALEDGHVTWSDRCMVKRGHEWVAHAQLVVCCKEEAAPRRLLVQKLLKGGGGGIWSVSKCVEKICLFSLRHKR